MIRSYKKWYDVLRRMWIRWNMLIISDPCKKANWLRKHNIFHYIGENVNYKSVLLPAEPFLVAIHDNVYIAADVRLVTHSLVSTVFNNYSKTRNFYAPYGKIEIHSNVFIGAGATIMYGVTIGENCIIAAGAIVTKDVPSGSVVAGVPAKVIGSFYESMCKSENMSACFVGKVKSRAVIDMLQIKPINFNIDTMLNNKYDKQK